MTCLISDSVAIWDNSSLFRSENLAITWQKLRSHEKANQLHRRHSTFIHFESDTSVTTCRWFIQLKACRKPLKINFLPNILIKYLFDWQHRTRFQCHLNRVKKSWVSSAVGNKDQLSYVRGHCLGVLCTIEVQTKNTDVVGTAVLQMQINCCKSVLIKQSQKMYCISWGVKVAGA